jgi:hypothetical protein
MSMVFYFVSNTCMPWFNFYMECTLINGNLALAEKCSGPLRFRLRQVLLYNESPSWEADKLLANQEILHILWNLQVCYCAHNTQSPSWPLNQYMRFHFICLRFISVLSFAAEPHQ